MITPELIRALGPTLPPDLTAEIARTLDSAAQAAQINTRLRVAAFVSQLAHESAGFRYLEEIWGPTAAQRRYEGRVDLGNVQSGDGYRFRGRGWILDRRGAASAFCLAHAGTAFTSPVLPPKGIRRSELMATLAMRFSGILSRWRFTAHHVFDACNHFQMIWIHTCAVAAQMVNNHAGGDRTARGFIGDTVRQTVIMLRIPNAPISGLWVLAGRPFPASGIFVNANLRGKFAKPVKRHSLKGFPNQGRRACLHTLQPIGSIVFFDALNAFVVQTIGGMGVGVKVA